MTHIKCSVVALFAAASLGALPVDSSAQSSSAIVGVVKDNTGAVLPGVTVEAASPALIEKVRSVLTDGQGAFRITELRPGIYTVNFTLSGFTAMRREGIELTTGFTATVNAELRVGSIEETITVSGAAPIVDVQNVVQQQVFSRSVLDSIPVGRSVQAYAALIPGARVGTAAQDVGGVTQGSTEFTVHGGTSDARNMVAGISFDSPQRPGGNLSSTTNKASVQEVSVEVGGMNAESQTGGVQMHYVPKDGGNVFSGSFATDYTTGALQSENGSDELRARGLRDPNALKKLYDYSFGVGGPIRQDKIWFYTAHRWQGSQTWQPSYWNAEPKASWSYTPDLNRQAYLEAPYQISSARVTFQASQQHRLTVNFENQAGNCQCFNSLAANVTPEAAAHHRYSPQYLGYVTWTYPATNRLLFEATGALYRLVQNAEAVDGVTSDLIPVQELSSGLVYRARANMTEGSSYYYKDHNNYTQRLVMSYVTGSNAFKTGVMVQQNLSEHTHTPHGDSLYRFRDGKPAELQMWATPWHHSETMSPIIGLFAQDQLTLRGVTLNLGLRYDSMNGHIPEQVAPAGRWIPERRFERVDDVLSWKDISPRVGIAWDVFGGGRTAVKASLGRYVLHQGTGDLIAAFNPMNQLVIGATRQWDDANSDFVPQEAELGPVSNTNFGTVIAGTRYSEDVTRGFGVREYNWQGSVSFQHELRRGTSVNVGYFRTSYGNPLAVSNEAITLADYDEYCLPAPSNPGLPGGGGNPICGLYDINPDAFGQVDEFVTLASDYGKVTRVFNGVDVTLTSRFNEGAMLAGGFSTGSTTRDSCELSADVATVARTQTAIVASSPNQRFCRISPPWSAETQLKFYGVYPLKWGLQVSGILQNLPGPEILANYNVTNALARPYLGRNLSSGRAVVPLLEPSSTFEDRITQLDLRVAKNFRVGKVRLTGSLDAYNALNANPILTVNNTYGLSWKNVQSILAGRLFKFGLQMDF
jgi:hypothetical protein